MNYQEEINRMEYEGGPMVEEKQPPKLKQLLLRIQKWCKKFKEKLCLKR